MTRKYVALTLAVFMLAAGALIGQAAVEFVAEIDASGSPSRGPEGAPVVIAVYNDFQ
jgi:hypothetical protein